MHMLEHISNPKLRQRTIEDTYTNVNLITALNSVPGTRAVAEVESGAEGLLHGLCNVLCGRPGGGEGDGHGSRDVCRGRGVVLHGLGERLLQRLGDLLAGGTRVGEGLGGNSKML